MFVWAESLNFFFLHLILRLDLSLATVTLHGRGTRELPQNVNKDAKGSSSDHWVITWQAPSAKTFWIGIKGRAIIKGKRVLMLKNAVPSLIGTSSSFPELEIQDTHEQNTIPSSSSQNGQKRCRILLLSTLCLI